MRVTTHWTYSLTVHALVPSAHNPDSLGIKTLWETLRWLREGGGASGSRILCWSQISFTNWTILWGIFSFLSPPLLYLNRIVLAVNARVHVRLVDMNGLSNTSVTTHKRRSTNMKVPIRAPKFLSLCSIPGQLTNTHLWLWVSYYFFQED